MKYFILLTILCVSLMLVEVNSIHCPNADPLQISYSDLILLLHEDNLWTSKYIAAPDSVDSIWFPTEPTILSYIQYTSKLENAWSMDAVIFTPHSVTTPNVLHYSKYELHVDPHKPIFQITSLVEQGLRTKNLDTGSVTDTDIPISDADIRFRTLTFALIYVNDEFNAWFNIFQSCDGKYAWVHIEAITASNLLDEGKDPFVELSDEIDDALNALNIGGGVIYNTANNILFEFLNPR